MMAKRTPKEKGPIVGKIAEEIEKPITKDEVLLAICKYMHQELKGIHEEIKKIRERFV